MWVALANDVKGIMKGRVCNELVEIRLAVSKDFRAVFIKS